MSNQDKETFKRTVWQAWAVSYNQRHHAKGESVTLELVDLNDSIIDSYY